ncbi:DNA adenine methylase [Peijinzhouia sedimentorum]
MEKLTINKKTPISYYGGKQTMLKHLLPLIPEHTVYTECFAGGAAMLFAKQPSPVEVINDLNSELINFYWAATVYYDRLKIEIDKTLHSRGVYEHASYIYNHPTFFDPIQRAWALWVLTKVTFASRIDGSFGFDKSKGGMTTKLHNAKDAFTQELVSRLERVTIEREDALKVIKRFDTEAAFHFVDPPYINSECGHYSGMFTHTNLIALLELLSAIKGKFILTMYPHEDIDLYAQKNGWTIKRVERTISSSRVGRKKKEEWIVMNY